MCAFLRSGRQKTHTAQSWTIVCGVVCGSHASAPIDYFYNSNNNNNIIYVVMSWCNVPCNVYLCVSVMYTRERKVCIYIWVYRENAFPLKPLTHGTMGSKFSSAGPPLIWIHIYILCTRDDHRHDNIMYRI